MCNELRRRPIKAQLTNNAHGGKPSAFIQLPCYESNTMSTRYQPHYRNLDLYVRSMCCRATSTSHYSVRKLRVETRNAVSFWVNLSRFALSRLLLTSANNLLKASLNFAWLAESWVPIR